MTRLIASDGLEYEDLAARLLNRPLENKRNWAIRSIREYHSPEKGNDPRHEVEAYLKGYNREIARPRTWLEKIQRWVALRDARKRGTKTYTVSSYEEYRADVAGHKALSLYRNPLAHECSGTLYSTRDGSFRDPGPRCRSRSFSGACLAYSLPPPSAALRSAYQSALFGWLGSR